MIRLEMKNYNMIITEKMQKYPHYLQVKLRIWISCRGINITFLLKQDNKTGQFYHSRKSFWKTNKNSRRPKEKQA